MDNRLQLGRSDYAEQRTSDLATALHRRIFMRPSSLGGAAYCVALCLSVCPSVPLSDVVFYFTVEPSYERTSKIEKFLFSLMGQRHVCTFRHALRAAYRTAISAAQILVFSIILCSSIAYNREVNKWELIPDIVG